jgi:hypothetical protein
VHGFSPRIDVRSFGLLLHPEGNELAIARIDANNGNLIRRRYIVPRVESLSWEVAQP